MGFDFTNGYGGYLSFDDEVCLCQTLSGDAPSDLPTWDDEDEDRDDES